MGSSPSVEHGAPSSGHGAVVHPSRPPPLGDMQSPVSSVQTDGRGGGDGSSGLQRSQTMARARARPTFPKRLVKGRILFLGLDGAGKTTLVTQLQRLGATDDPTGDCRSPVDAPSSTESARVPSPINMLQSMTSRGDLQTPNGGRIPRLFPDPTKATSTSFYRLDGDKHVQLVDVPGRRMYRASHWRAALMGDASSSSTGATPNAPGSAVPIVGVVFVVDATDHTRFPLVARELVAFQKLKDARAPNGTPTPLAAWLQRAPFLMVLNKVDAAASSGGPGSPQDPNSVERRRASRMMRQLLKSAFDHQLRMDQKRHPRDYAAASEPPAHPPPAPASAGASPSNAHSTAPSSSKKRAALAEVNSNRKTLLMTSIVECCAFDHDCVRAIQTLLRDDVKRLWSGAT